MFVRNVSQLIYKLLIRNLLNPHLANFVYPLLLIVIWPQEKNNLIKEKYFCIKEKYFVFKKNTFVQRNNTFFEEKNC